ncbi:MAG: 2-oxoacid:acceptor oxidoreductase family protein [Bacillota bacterium]|jgi:2-oxoglutarate ferredoxin oxidoreductase subunit gamma
MNQTTKIVICGEGGQGIQSLANIMAEAAYSAGKQVLYIPNFGVEQRGGVSLAFVQISDEVIGSPKFATGDVVVALSDRAVRRLRSYVGSKTIFIYDSGIKGIKDEIPTQANKIMEIPAVEIALHELQPRVFNVLVLGVLIGVTGAVGIEEVKHALENKFGYKFVQYPELKELNFKALERGTELIQSKGG